MGGWRNVVTEVSREEEQENRLGEEPEVRARGERRNIEKRLLRVIDSGME